MYRDTLSDFTREDIIDLRNLAGWLRDFADPDLYDAEDYPAEDVAEAVTALGGFLAELGYAGYETWERIADQLQEIGDNDEPTLIRRSYFKDYARDYAEEGDVEDSRLWPLTHIDWQAAADELETDYSSADLAGVEFLIRSF